MVRKLKMNLVLKKLFDLNYFLITSTNSIGVLSGSKQNVTLANPSGDF